ncbi:MAG: PAS domain-containing sensor histidine kinase [Chloroflexi bacterium]|nr:PAS domain-containing sensor histidine kinase [Chloroflexota bacterium]
MFPLHTEIQEASPEVESAIQPVLDALRDHIAILNDKGEIVAVNAAWRRLASTGNLRRDNCGIGQIYLTLCQRSTAMNLPDAAQITAGIRDLVDGISDRYQQEYLVHSPLGRCWYQLRAARFELQGESRVLVAHQDVSDLKAARQQQKGPRKVASHKTINLLGYRKARFIQKEAPRRVTESQQTAQLLYDQSPSARFAVTPEGRIVNCNAAAQRIFGYSREELEDTSIDRIFKDTHYNSDNLHELNGNHKHALIGRRRNGDEFPILFNFDKLEGIGTGLCTVTVQDLSETENSQDENRDARNVEGNMQGLNGQFLTMMAHELRSPLASIRLSYDMLTHYSKQATEDERAQYLDNIRLQVDHLNEVLGDVMSLSKADRGELEFNPERGDLTTFCHNIVESFQINHSHSHKIDFECASAELFANFDRRLLRRAVTNLIDNAIKYSPRGGNVIFCLWQEGARAHISVSDEGIGIPPDEAGFLFDAFHRASNVGSLPGTGLGLAIAKQAIERHGGVVSLPPQSDIGATFFIELPLESEREQGRSLSI